MPKRPELHRYSDQTAFDRLFVAIATLARYPGVGCATGETKSGQHHALVEVRTKMQSVARALNLHWEDNYPATATIRKDLELLKDYGILDRRMYRWGYYLGKGAIDLAELSCVLDALNSQAKYQGDPFARQIAARLAKRFKGLNLSNEGRLFYPIRQQIDTLIVFTDPSEIDLPGRDLSIQRERLDLAHLLLTNGWGLYLGSLDEQRAELAKTLMRTKIVVRFWSPVLTFIQEGERRHHTQRIRAGKRDDLGRMSYLDYEVTLPPSSVNEFMLWVNRFMDAAQIISPPVLIDRHLAQARGIVAKYQKASSD